PRRGVYLGKRAGIVGLVLEYANFPAPRAIKDEIVHFSAAFEIECEGAVILMHQVVAADSLTLHRSCRVTLLEDRRIEFGSAGSSLLLQNPDGAGAGSVHHQMIQHVDRFEIEGKNQVEIGVGVVASDPVIDREISGQTLDGN